MTITNNDSAWHVTSRNQGVSSAGSEDQDPGNEVDGSNALLIYFW
jgi:hypothetical protein